MKARQSKFVKGLIAACILSPLVLFGAIVVYADYVGPQHRSTTTYTSQRKKCYYEASLSGYTCYMTRYTAPSSACMTDVAGFFNDSSGACGPNWPIHSYPEKTCKTEGTCTITLTETIMSCTMDQTGCREVAHTTGLPPAAISGTLNCTTPGSRLVPGRGQPRPDRQRTGQWLCHPVDRGHAQQ